MFPLPGNREVPAFPCSPPPVVLAVPRDSAWPSIGPIGAGEMGQERSCLSRRLANSSDQAAVMIAVLSAYGPMGLSA